MDVDDGGGGGGDDDDDDDDKDDDDLNNININIFWDNDDDTVDTCDYDDASDAAAHDLFYCDNATCANDDHNTMIMMQTLPRRRC
jgi:hypothetical protein